MVPSNNSYSSDKQDSALLGVKLCLTAGWSAQVLPGEFTFFSNIFHRSDILDNILNRDHGFGVNFENYIHYQKQLEQYGIISWLR